MKYYLLKVIDPYTWEVSESLPYHQVEHITENTKFVELSNFGETGDYIEREVRVNLGED